MRRVGAQLGCRPAGAGSSAFQRISSSTSKRGRPRKISMRRLPRANSRRRKNDRILIDLRDPRQGQNVDHLGPRIENFELAGDGKRRAHRKKKGDTRHQEGGGLTSTPSRVARPRTQQFNVPRETVREQPGGGRGRGDSRASIGKGKRVYRPYAEVGRSWCTQRRCVTA